MHPSHATEHHDLEFLRRVSPLRRSALNVRCAYLALRILRQLSFPVAPPARQALERAVEFLGETAGRLTPAEGLEAVARETGQLAHALLTDPRCRADRVVGHVACAVHWAVRVALTGFVTDAQEAVAFAFRAARLAGVREIEMALKEALRRNQPAVACSVEILKLTHPVPFSLSHQAAVVA
jgi:hypothetical protein